MILRDLECFRGIAIPHFQLLKSVDLLTMSFHSWHQDIRPENILINRRGNNSKPHDYHFMLGDLGLSHFVRMCRNKDDPGALDTGGTITYGKSFSCPLQSSC